MKQEILWYCSILCEKIPALTCYNFDQGIFLQSYTVIPYVTGSAKTGHNGIFVKFLLIKYLESTQLSVLTGKFSAPYSIVTYGVVGEFAG